MQLVLQVFQLLVYLELCRTQTLPLQSFVFALQIMKHIQTGQQRLNDP